MNKEENKTKRIGIDARFYGPVGKGLGRYTQEVVDNMLKIDNQNEYVIFLCKENFDVFKSNNPKVKKVLADVRWYTALEQVLMPYYIWREKLDLVHFHHFNVPVFCPKKFVVTIHDLILIRFPSVRASTLSPIFYKIKNFAYQMVLSRAIHKSQKIIAVSKFTKDDIIDHFKIDDKKIFVTHEGVSNYLLNEEGDGRVNSDEILNKYSIKKPYLVYVGNAYPHKNLDGLINVFAQSLKEVPELKLVLVGKDDYFYKHTKDWARKNNLWGEGNDKVIFPGYVPDQDLKFLYRGALAYVFPSKYEGFGIPPLEAMANHCPVLSSDQASMPEILGDAALYFNPFNKHDMRDKIIKIAQDKGVVREDLIKKGLEQIKKYSWEGCAKKTLAILNSLL